MTVIPWILAVAASAIAAADDIRHRRIANTVTGPLLVTGLIWSTSVHGIGGLGTAMAGAVVAGFPFLVLWLIGGGGAGDAKLMLGVGAMLGPRLGLVALAITALAGGVMSIGYAIHRRQVGRTVTGMGVVLGLLPFLIRGPGRLADRREMVPRAPARACVPYAVAILIGVIGTGILMWCHQQGWIGG